MISSKNTASNIRNAVHTVIAAVLCILTAISCTGKEKHHDIKKWGYVHHVAALSKKYITNKVPGYNTISITGFTIIHDGSIKSGLSANVEYIIKTAVHTGARVIPLFSFSSVHTGRRVLNSKKLRSNTISSIIQILKKNNFNGIHLDFEYLPPEKSPALARFIKETRSRVKDIPITMAIFPPVDFPKKWAGFHDPETIAPLLDEVVIMCYDYHRSGTAPGPVTDVSWAEKNIQKLLKIIPPDNIWLGIPAYGYRWQYGKNGAFTKARAISARYGKKLMSRYSYTRHRSGTVHIEWTAKGKKYLACFSDKKTRAMLEGLAKKYGLRGTAIWRLGFEEQ